MKRHLLPGVVLAVAVLTAGPADSFGRESAPSPSGDAPPRLWERVEIVVFGGLGLPAAGGTSLHRAETASPAPFPTVENRIRTSSAPAVFTGAAAAFFLKNGFGIQAGFGYLKAGLESVGRFAWNSPGSTPASTAVDGGGEGEITSVPFFIGIFKSFEFRFAGKALRAHIAAGPALFFHSILTSSQAGAAAIRDGLTDAILVPVRVEDTTWISPRRDGRGRIRSPAFAGPFPRRRGTLRFRSAERIFLDLDAGRLRRDFSPGDRFQFRRGSIRPGSREDDAFSRRPVVFPSCRGVEADFLSRRRAANVLY